MPEFLKVSKEQFRHVLTEEGVLRAGDVELLRAFYHISECEASASQLVAILGSKHVIVVNGVIGRLGHRIADRLSLNLPDEMGYWNILATGRYEGAKFIWTLKTELIEALTELGLLTTNDDTLFPDEIGPKEDLLEGAVRPVSVNAYERNPIARQICIEHFGLRCLACGFDFFMAYGELGEGFIHVHHLRELSTIGATYKVNPIEDLRPVCPNCHAMLHRRKPALSIEDLQKLLHR